ncbi:hypothetical protein ACGF5F_32600 [Streptomyces sp. NPDC047821]|uniref:hypothetical protein n=1 Tax=Streptomyces sp. NPDC047821 TaxID=3365488 RepID=UPI003722E518
MFTPHPFVISADGTDVDWTHPTACPDGERCEIRARANGLPLPYMAELAAGRPDGTYWLSLYGVRGLCLVDATGRLLPEPQADAA